MGRKGGGLLLVIFGTSFFAGNYSRSLAIGSVRKDTRWA